MKLLVTVTFNENQLRSHLLPILRIPEVEEVVLVADTEPPPLPKLRAIVPSAREQRLIGRAASKLAHCIALARRLKPTWVVSYNVMPHGVNGLLAASAARVRTMYHVIGGDVEWQGGGWLSDNALLGRLPRPVPPVERALLGVIRRCDVVCTMGTSARASLVAAGLPPDRLAVTPPSIDDGRFAPDGTDKTYDVVAVGTLSERKRFHDFVDLVARLRATRPAVRAAIAGDGPLRDELVRRAEARGVAEAIDFLGRRTDIENVYRRGRVFVLTSRDEGLSVAMLEAMASGLPAVVPRVGDLGDVVRDGRNGYLVPVGDVDAYAEKIHAVLENLEPMCAAARADAVAHASVEHVSDIYRTLLLKEAA